MTQHETEAVQLILKFRQKLAGKCINSTAADWAAKEAAILCVDEIILAITVTTGHLELRRLDEQELQNDFDFWQKVKKEIEQR